MEYWRTYWTCSLNAVQYTCILNTLNQFIKCCTIDVCCVLNTLKQWTLNTLYQFPKICILHVLNVQLISWTFLEKSVQYTCSGKIWTIVCSVHVYTIFVHVYMLPVPLFLIPSGNAARDVSVLDKTSSLVHTTKLYNCT